MILSEKIGALRREKGLSQEALAERCGVSRQAIAKWENNISTPSVNKLALLADVFDVTLDELVGRKFKDEYTQLKEFVVKFVPSEIKFGPKDEVCCVIGRYLSFVDDLGLDAEVKFKGLESIFLRTVDEYPK